MYLVKSLSCHSVWEFEAPLLVKLEHALEASLFVIDVVTTAEWRVLRYKQGNRIHRQR